MKMDTSTWKEFRIGDLFGVILSLDDLQAKKMNEGPIPLVSSGSTNNGVCAYVEELENVQTFPGGTITVDMFGKAFYQPNDYYAVSHGRVNMLLAEFPLHDEHGLFLQSVLDATIGHKYSYAYMCTSKKLIDEVIKLPATVEGNPDWNYMEQYMRSVMENCEKKYQTLVRISQEKHQVDTTAWGEFRVGDLFEIVPCKGINSTLLEDGDDVPYIAASRVNNGFNRMVSAVDVESWISKGNCLQLIHIGDAAAGWVNYIQNDFIGMSGKSSCAYNERMNEYSGTFIASVLCARNEGQYSFKESWTGEKVVNTVIKLPITSSGEPDWDYMEQYMKDIMQRQNNVVEALKKIS